MVPQTPFKQTSKRPSRLLPPLTSLSSQSVEQTTWLGMEVWNCYNFIPSPNQQQKFGQPMR
jgi:hypothetical protein